MPLPGLLAAVLALAAPSAGGASTVAVMPFENLSGVPAARAEVTAAVLKHLESAGYRVVPAASVDEFVAAERLRYLDSLSNPERKKLLETLGADAVVLGSIYSFLDGGNAIVAAAARMLRADGSVVWSSVEGLSAQDTQGLFGIGRVPTVRALANAVVSRLLRHLPRPGQAGSIAGAKAKPFDIPGPRTYRSAALPEDGPILVCILPLANRSPARVAPRVVGELLVQRLAGSKQLRAVESADFRQALVAARIRVIRLGDPDDLRHLAKELGTNLFLQGTIDVYQDGSTQNESVPPVFELQLQLVSAKTGKVLWTASLARKGTDYQGLLELGAISNVVTLADQAIAEIVASFDHTEGTGRHGVTATVVASDKTYDRSEAATITSCKVSGAPAADLANLQCAAAAASFADASAGTGKTVTATGLTLSGSAANRYVLEDDTASTTGTIRPKPVTVSAAASDKTYDGTPSATIASCTPSGVLPADADAVACAAGNASFADSGAGSGKTVSVGGITLSGAASGNYAPSSTAVTTTATIRRKPVTPEVSVASKTYDGTVSATLAACGFQGVLAADASGTSCRVGAADFGDAAAGVEKPVTVTGIGISGPASANYVVTETLVETTADIVPRSVTASVTAADKTYDGTPAAAISGCRLTRVIEIDSGKVECAAGAGAFADRNAGAGKTVTAPVALAGAAAGNYVLATPVGTTNAGITPKPLSPSGVIARDKVYDGTNSARLDLGAATLPGAVEGDDVALDGSREIATFPGKDVAANEIVTVSGLALAGRDAGNYALEPFALRAAIAPRPAGPRIAAANKVYDGTRAAELTGASLDGVLAADAESVRLTVEASTFDTKNAGTGRTVTATSLSLSGDASRNYSVPQTARTKADIMPKHVTGSFTAANKRYDASPLAIVRSRSLTGVIPGDAVALTGGRARFADAAVGSEKTVTLEGAKLTGADSRNYVLDTVAPTTADITASRREPQ